MNKKILNVLENNFQWMKKDFFLMLALIIASKIAMKVVDFYFVIEMSFIIILTTKSFLFNAVYSLQPTALGKDQFSWKFFQGLPLNKKEIILSLTASTLLSSIPLFLCMICFGPKLNKEIFHLNIPFEKIFINFILLLIFMNLLNIKRLIEFPRIEYQKRNANHSLISFLRNILVFICITLYVFIGSEFINQRFNFDLLSEIGHAINLLSDLFVSWWMPPIFSGIIFLTYLAVLKIWTDEKKSYRSNVWNPKKELSLILGSCSLLFFAYTNIKDQAPELYQGTLMEAVYQRNFKAIENELRLNPNINVKNKFGMTAMLVAIKEGHFNMVMFLEKRGANFEGRITSKKDPRNGFDALMLAVDSGNELMLDYLVKKYSKHNDYNKEVGFYPIHLAAYHCNSRMVDTLLKNGSEVNALNRDGQSPLLVAAKRSCFSTAVLLKEAGAKFNITDKKGKDVLSLLKDRKYDSHYSRQIGEGRNREFQYFLERSMRAPSSIDFK